MEKQEVLRGSFSAFIRMNCFSTNKLDPLTFNKHEILEMEKSAILFCNADYCTVQSIISCELSKETELFS